MRNKIGEVNKVRILKEFKSFQNKIGKNTIWFNALSNKKQWDLFFKWKRHKWISKKVYPVKQPVSLRNFIYICQKNIYFKVPKSIMRDKQINKILDETILSK